MSINVYLLDTTRAKFNKKSVATLDYWYKKFNLKKLILKEIKENLV